MNRAEFAGEYAAAMRQADRMFALREQLHAISGFFHIPESTDPGRRYFAGSHYWNLTQRRAFYQTMLDRTTGQTGDLVARSVRQVPFRLDDADLGRFGRWYDADFDRSDWRTIDTATPFFLQGDGMLDARGVPYVGYMWYIFELDVPAEAVAKPIHVYAPIVATEAWVWCNGEYVGHRPYFEAYIRPQALEFDVTPMMKAGKNIIGVRVNTSASRIQMAKASRVPCFSTRPNPCRRRQRHSDVHRRFSVPVWCAPLSQRHIQDHHHREARHGSHSYHVNVGLGPLRFRDQFFHHDENHGTGGKAQRIGQDALHVQYKYGAKDACDGFDDTGRLPHQKALCPPHPFSS